MHWKTPEKGPTCHSLDVLAQAIGHQIKAAIRRDEGNGSVVFESGQPNALMELYVFQVHCFVQATALGLEEDLKRPAAQRHDIVSLVSLT